MLQFHRLDSNRELKCHKQECWELRAEWKRFFVTEAFKSGEIHHPILSYTRFGEILNLKVFIVRLRFP